MSARPGNRMRTLGACALLAAAPLAAQSKKPAAKEAPPPPPKIDVAVEAVVDRRTTSDFPRPSLGVTLSLGGADAAAVSSVRPRVTRATGWP